MLHNYPIYAEKWTTLYKWICDSMLPETPKSRIITDYVELLRPTCQKNIEKQLYMYIPYLCLTVAVHVFVYYYLATE